MTEPTHDLADYLETARRRAKRAGARAPERHAQAWQIARDAASLIRARYPGARVRVFGSLLYPESFGVHSDIDLAVEGIPWPDYLLVWSELERREPEFEIDLVDVGIISSAMREVIEREGIPL